MSKINYLWGYVDHTGNLVIEPRFHDASDFSEGLAAVRVDWARGYIDTTGRYVIEPQYEKASAFHDGVAEVTANGCKIYINRHGEAVSAPAVRETAEREQHDEELIPVLEGNRYGYATAEGETVIPARYCEAAPFSEGVARVKKSLTSGWMFIDKTGRKAFDGTFRQAGDFADGLARVLVGVRDE